MLTIWVDVWLSNRSEHLSCYFREGWSQVVHGATCNSWNQVVHGASFALPRYLLSRSNFRLPSRRKGLWNHGQPGSLELRLGTWVMGDIRLAGPLPTSPLDLGCSQSGDVAVPTCARSNKPSCLCAVLLDSQMQFALRHPLHTICKHLRVPSLWLWIGDLTSSSLSLPLPTPLHFLPWHLRGWAGSLVCPDDHLWRPPPPLQPRLHFAPPFQAQMPSPAHCVCYQMLEVANQPPSFYIFLYCIRLCSS